MKNCHRCHPSGNAGTGFSILNNPLTGFFIRIKTRNGYEIRQSFNKEHLCEEKLSKTVTYLKE